MLKYCSFIIHVTKVVTNEILVYSVTEIKL